MRYVWLLLVLIGFPVHVEATVYCGNTSMSTLGLEGSPAVYTRSPEKMAELLVARANIVPRDANGVPSPTGKYMMLGAGYSNSEVNVHEANIWFNDTRKNPALIRGWSVQQGQTANVWADPNNIVWTRTDQVVFNKGLTRNQVAVVVMMMTQQEPAKYGPLTESLLRTINANVHARYPYAMVLWLNNPYSGYAGLGNVLHPEPSSREDALLYASLMPSSVGTWSTVVEWGLDLWADGVNVNPATGINYNCIDFSINGGGDGIHLSWNGYHRIAQFLVNRWMADSFFCGWYNRTCN